MSKNQPENNLGAVLIVPIDEETGKIALVMEPSKPSPHYWKFPAGGIKWIDFDPLHPFGDRRAADKAAIREAKEETGLTVQVIPFGIMPKKTLTGKTHTMYLYVGLANFAEMVKEGEEGEITQAFSVEEIDLLKSFMPGHRAILQQAIENIRT